MSTNSRRILVAGLCALLTSSAVAGTAVPVSGERRLTLMTDGGFSKAPRMARNGPHFDDAKWHEVRLPHDWAIDGPFDPKLNPHTGALPDLRHGLVSQVLHRFRPSLKGRYFTIEFDGAMSNAQRLAQRPASWADARTATSASPSI